LTPALTRAMSETNLPIIGLTSPDKFQKFIFSNQKILEYFEKIEVSVPGKVEAMEILEDIAPYFERKTGVVATFPALKEIVNQSDRWVTEIPFPEKAIELLDDCLVYAQGLPVRHPELVSGSRFLQPEHVRQVLAEKTKIPLQELSAGEKEVIAGMEEILHKRVIGQDHAIADIAKALRRRKAGVGAGKRPIGAFLFLGPTGVGKTETAKALAEALFGSEKKMIRLDMAQFQARGAIDRLIGSFARNEPGILTSAVRQNPYSVLLLDEIEKASREVQNLFLTAIDEGYLTDTFGHVVNLENLLIIGTSNAGAEFIRQKIVSSRHPELGSGSIEVEIPKRVRNDSRAVNYQKLSDQLTDFVLREGLFSPEFINRFDALVVYDPLDHNELVQIARLQLELLNKRLAEKKISVEITDDLLDKIARLGYDPTFGARPMKRVIADKVEDVIAKKILAGEIKKGEKIRIEI